MNNAHPEPQGGGLIFSPNEVRQWVSRARSFRPVVPESVSDYLVGAYVRLRQQQKRDEASSKTFTHTSPRTLLGILRLSQALARLRFADHVITDDVDEALRLVEVSKASLYDDNRDRRADQSPSTKIFNLIRGMRESGAAATGEGRGEMDLRRVRERVLAKGFTVTQLEECLEEYASIDVSFLPLFSLFLPFAGPLCNGMACGEVLFADVMIYELQIWQTAAEGTRLVFIETGDDFDMDDEDF
jgi:DNA replication licensing factor MCM7